MSIRVVMITTPDGFVFKFQSDNLTSTDARKIDVALSEAGFQIERVKDPTDVGLGQTPAQGVLDDFYGD